MYLEHKLDYKLATNEVPYFADNKINFFPPRKIMYKFPLYFTVHMCFRYE